MNFIFKYFLFGICLFGALSLRAETPLKIITLNAHCYMDDWEFRWTRILDYLVQSSPDFIALQEVCTKPAAQHSQIEFIRSYMNQRGYPVKSLEAFYTHKAWDQYDEYLVMVSKHSSQQIEKGFLPKSILQRGYLALQWNGQWYINIHLEHAPEHALSRKDQLNFIQNRFMHDPHIIMGDFNSAPESFEHSGLRNQNYFALFPGNTFIDAQGTPVFRIDGYWLSPRFKQQFSHYDASLQLNRPHEGRFLSDHFAVQLLLYSP